MRIILLLILMIFVGSFPFISDWLVNGRNGVACNEENINNIIKKYIDNNPDHVMDALENYNVKQKQEAHQLFIKNAIKDNMEQIDDRSYPKVGEGNITVVEFFDYSCGYCKRIGSEVSKIVDDNKDKITYVFRGLPLFGNASDLVARAAIAVNVIEPSYYLDFHSQALAYEGQYTEEIITEMVSKIGIDLDDFKVVWNSEEVKSKLQDSVNLFHKLGMNGTPSFVTCGQVIIGADLGSLKNAIEYCDDPNMKHKPDVFPEK